MYLLPSDSQHLRHSPASWLRLSPPHWKSASTSLTSLMADTISSSLTLSPPHWQSASVSLTSPMADTISSSLKVSIYLTHQPHGWDYLLLTDSHHSTEVCPQYWPSEITNTHPGKEGEEGGEREEGKKEGRKEEGEYRAQTVIHCEYYYSKNSY